MIERRPVRVDTQFFSELDAQLGVTRGPHGEPSASDFLLIDLPSVADQFAERFDEPPAMYPTGDDDRDLVTTARLVAAVLARCVRSARAW